MLINIGKAKKIHPFEKASQLNRPYVYWHRREIQAETINEAIRRGTSIEFDIAYDEDNDSIYIGHPKEFYTIEKKIPLPNNIDIDKAVQMLEGAEDVVVVLDCKHKLSLPKIKEIVVRLGVHRCILHSFIKEWSAPYPARTHMEAHWRVEDVPYQEIKRFIDETGVKTIGAIHALSEERIRAEKLLDRALSMARGFESLSIYLPNVKVPAEEFLRKILAAGYLPWISQDELNKSAKNLDFAYVAMTDDPNMATISREFFKK